MAFLSLPVVARDNQENGANLRDDDVDGVGAGAGLACGGGCCGGGASGTGIAPESPCIVRTVLESEGISREDRASGRGVVTSPFCDPKLPSATHCMQSCRKALYHPPS